MRLEKSKNVLAFIVIAVFIFTFTLSISIVRVEGADTSTFDYTGDYTGTLTVDGEEAESDNETYAAEDTDENAVLVENAGTLEMTNATLTKTGDDTDGDSCNFYGVNSIFLVVNDGSMAYISDSTLTADSEGSNGIFSTDSATVYADNVTINTSAGNSRGLDATYGGTIIANAMEIETLGDHCASIATDRGGGYISVTNSSLSTEGSGSPILYSTGDVEVCNVVGIASGSQLVGMEGYNTVLIYDSDLTSTNTSLTGSDPIQNGVIIYQSTSGDADTSTGSTATFEASDSSLTSAITSGAMFYCTNTTANIVLSNTTLSFDSDNANLLSAIGNDSNSWGTAGSNGAIVTFTCLGETITGDVEVDTISSVDMYLLESTTYTGSTTITENDVNTDTTDAPMTMNIDSTSTWVVTADSTVTDLNAESGSSIVDEDGNTVTIVVDGETVVTGDSSYTITVTDSYTTTVTTDSENQLSDANIDRSDFDTYYSLDTVFADGTTDDTETSIENLDAELEYEVTTYDGTAKTPSVTIDGLTEDEDYTVEYSDNTDVGKATVTITGTGDYTGTITLTFKIKLATVTNLKTKSCTASSLKLSWSAVEGATSYKIYRYYNGSWHYYKTTSNTFTKITSLSAGSKYRFRVRAYDSETKTYSSYIYYTGKTRPVNVSDLSVKAKTKSTITVSWDKSSGANRYKVYIYYGGKWHYVKTTSNLTAKVTGLVSGKTYKVRVRAYNNNTKTYSSSYTTIKVKTK